MSTSSKTRTKNVRIGKNLRFSTAQLEAIAALHDADHARVVKLKRTSIGKLNDLVNRFRSSADVPSHVAIPVSKADHARLVRLAEQSGRAVESIVAGWVHDQIARVSGRRASGG